MASGGLAWLVASNVGAGVVVASGEQRADGNRDPHGVFKDALWRALDGTAVQSVIDVHGMADSFGFDVCLGTGADESRAQPLLEPVRTTLRAAGFVVSVNDPWAASAEHTVTNTVHRSGRLALQVEVARRWRQPWEDPRAAARMVSALSAAIGAAVSATR